MVESPSLAQLAKAALHTGHTFWPVWIVIGTILVFVLLHGRLDRRDPKLAAAPITDELLEFS